MGTSTIFQRWNDRHVKFADMSKEELEALDRATGYESEDRKLKFHGLTPIMECHNSDSYPLIWFNGRLMLITTFIDKFGTRKHFNKYKNKYERYSEWAYMRWIFKMYLESGERLYKKKMRRKVK